MSSDFYKEKGWHPNWREVMRWLVGGKVSDETDSLKMAFSS